MRADVKDVLRAEVAWVCGLNFAAGDIVITLFLKGNDPGFSQNRARSRNVLFQRRQTLLEVRQLMAQPD